MTQGVNGGGGSIDAFSSSNKDANAAAMGSRSNDNFASAAATVAFAPWIIDLL